MRIVLILLLDLYFLKTRQDRAARLRNTRLSSKGRLASEIDLSGLQGQTRGKTAFHQRRM